MKKIFYLFLIAGALSLGVNARAEAYTPMAGDLVKTANNPAVYIIDDNLKRHLFSNAVTYWTWHSGSWSDQKIKTITQDEFDTFDTGKNVIARPGANLIKFDNSNKTYAVTPGGVLCETRALYGDDWATRVIIIQSSFETDYVKDNACIITSNGKLPDGTLLQYLNSKDIWLIDAGKKRKVSATAFTANGFHESAIIKNVPVAMTYTAGTAINAFDYNLGILYSLNYSRGGEIAARPDFMISDIVFPTTQIMVNSSVEIKLIIKNTGGNAVSDLGLKNIVFTGQDWTTTKISHSSYPTAVSPLMSGQSFEVLYTGKFVASGEKNFTAKVNEPNEIVEINSVNNSYSEKIRVYSITN